MVDYQQVVDEIRSFLQTSDQTLNDQLKDLASAYAEACKEANLRLRRCEEFLHKGLHSEAIHLAQAEPALLDQVAALDFPERLQWQEVAFMYSLPAPPKLQLTTAAALNEAYAIVQPLEHLLRKHRLLALSRAPLPARLEVMRQIGRLDAGNPLWAEDIQEFEKTRIRQLETEVEQALASHDDRALETIVGEIRTTEWTTSMPLQLIQRVENLARQRERQRHLESLRTLETELHDAVAAFDVERVKRLRERWNSVAAPGRHSLKDPLWDRANRAFEWLQEQERRQAEERKHRAAMTDLESALTDDNIPLNDLDQFYRAVLMRDGPLPEALEERYRMRVGLLKVAGRRRQRFLLGAALACGLAMAGCAGYGIYEWNQSSKLVETVRTLRRMRDAGETAEALMYLARLDVENPRIAQAPELTELRKQIVTEDARERQRAAQFREAFESAQAAPPDEAEPPALAKAQGLAHSTEEKNAVQRLARTRTERAQQARRERDLKFQDQVNELRKQIDDLERLQAQAPDSPKVVTLLRNLQTEVARLGREAKGISEDRRELLKALSTRLDVVRQSLGKAALESERTEPGTRR